MLGVALRNPEFKKLWLSQLVSQSGNWFNRVAVLTLIAKLGGETAAMGSAYAFELAVRLLPTAAFSSLAGPVADRISRRTLMVVADLLQAVTVLLLIFCDEPGELNLLYVLVAAQVALGVFFYAAQSASIPNTVPKEELHEATALSAATWSVALALGTLLGGWAADVVGINTVFVINAASFLVSAAFIARLELPAPPKRDTPFRWLDIVLFTEMRAGYRHVRSLGLLPVLLAKVFWCPAGGYLVLLPILGMSFKDGETSGAFAIGALYCARGLGTAVGPILARKYWGSTDRQLQLQVSVGFAVAAAFYAGIGTAPSLWVAFTLVALAHAGGSTLWVASTTYWQRYVADEFRGRIYALEFLGMTLAFTVGALVAGALYDHWESTNRLALTISALVLVSGFAWTVLASRKLRVAAEPTST